MVFVAKSKKHTNSVHHKRRHGQHHKQSDHYLKPYWPYLPLALLVTLGVAFSSVLSAAPKHDVLAYATSMNHTDLLSGTNAERNATGLASLALNGQLNQAAQAKANDMVTRDYWSHNTPEGNPPWVFFTNAGYAYQTAGENLAYGFDTSSNAIAGWMNSPGHKANILNNTYQEVGFGIANSDNYQSTGPETVVVAMYAKPQVASATTTQPTTPAPVASKPATPAPTPAPTPVTEPEAAAEPTPEPEPELNTTPAPETAKDDDTKPVTSSNVSRIAVLTNGKAPWSVLVVSIVAIGAIALLIFRHGVFWHRALIKGEKFIIHHKLLDVALVLAIVIGFILTRTVGVIH